VDAGSESHSLLQLAGAKERLCPAALNMVTKYELTNRQATMAWEFRVCKPLHLGFVGSLVIPYTVRIASSAQTTLY
jgi:hypothetical protein